MGQKFDKNFEFLNISSLYVPFISATAKNRRLQAPYVAFVAPCRNPVKSVPRGKAFGMRMTGLCQFYWRTWLNLIYSDRVARKYCSNFIFSNVLSTSFCWIYGMTLCWAHNSVNNWTVNILLTASVLRMQMASVYKRCCSIVKFNFTWHWYIAAIKELIFFSRKQTKCCG